MAYFKVLIREEFHYEVLIRADNADQAEIEVLNSNDGWGDPIHVETQSYEVAELKIFNNEVREG